MLVTERDRLRQEIQDWAAAHGNDRSALMPILQEIQKRYFHVSEFAMQVVADVLGIHPVEVQGVVSFYSFLDTNPKGRFVVRLCRTISCDMAGKDRVARQLENDLGITFGQTTADGRFTLEWAECLGMCDQGPALLVNNKVFTKVTPERVHEILAECRGVFGVHAAENKEVRHS
jgi:[NiFe] hydrogenase diaphorase moiety large subunit